MAVGRRLGTYDITGTLGVGGMGEVYRANDTKLGREVAIKTLPSALANDRDRLARFEREAKLLAALNHAHIATIYGLDEHEGTHFLAMELVEGVTLEHKLSAGRLPLEQTLRLALQIAEALEAAHEKGVVHRDLKPANIMVTRDDVVKVLDFGLAKALVHDSGEPSPANSPASSLALTQQGLILGTAGYMAPEQASGQPTDQRADIWAFGVVLYEMLAGLPPFQGSSVPHVIAAVLQSEPDWSRLPNNLHPRLRLLLERCLEKDVRNRYHSIADARVDLEKVLSDPQPTTMVEAQRSLRSVVPLTIGLIVGALVVGSLAWALRPDGPPAAIGRFAYAITQSVTDDAAGRGRSRVALAPDGRNVVYSAANQLFLRPMDRLEARPIPGTEEKPLNPFFSPDGESVAYFAEDSLKRIPLSGGIPVVIARGVIAPMGASWNADGTILFGQPQGIFRVSADGGSPELVIEAGQGERLDGPELLPDGDTVLFSATTATWDDAQIVAQSLSTGTRTRLVQGGSDAHYIATGHLVYALADGLFAVAFDPRTLQVSGRSGALVQGLTRSAAGTTGTANYAVAADGTLIYLSRADEQPPLVVVWVDREGREEPTGLEIEASEAFDCSNLDLSPDGARFAFDCVSADAQEADVWTWSLAQRTRTRLTAEPGWYFGASWSPDSARIAYSSRGKGLFVRAADGSGTAEQVLDTGLAPWGWLEDDELIFTESDDSGDFDIGMLAMTGNHERRALLSTPFDERRPVVSPNGRWLAYQSDVSGRFEIEVRPFPDVDSRKWVVSTGGGEAPRWSGDGRTLFFVGPRAFMETAVGADADTFAHDTPEAVLDRGPYLLPDTQRPYDVSQDGQRFLLTRRSGNAIAPRLVIVRNWVEELKRRVPTK